MTWRSWEASMLLVWRLRAPRDLFRMSWMINNQSPAKTNEKINKLGSRSKSTQVNLSTANKSPARKMIPTLIKTRRCVASWKRSSLPSTTPSRSPRRRVCTFWPRTPDTKAVLKPFLRKNLAAGINDNQLTSPTKSAQLQSSKDFTCKKNSIRKHTNSSSAQPRVSKRRRESNRTTRPVIWLMKTGLVTRMQKSRLAKWTQIKRSPGKTTQRRSKCKS